MVDFFPTLPQVIQKPIELGANFVIQSTTKFYDGHNMTVGGAVVAATGLSLDGFRSCLEGYYELTHAVGIQ